MYSDFTILIVTHGRPTALETGDLGRSTRKDLREFPEPVQDHVGYALYAAQRGSRHRDTKTLSGFSGAGVVEVVTDFRGDTFRAVYTVRFAGAV